MGEHGGHFSHGGQALGADQLVPERAQAFGGAELIGEQLDGDEVVLAQVRAADAQDVRDAAFGFDRAPRAAGDARGFHARHQRLGVRQGGGAAREIVEEQRAAAVGDLGHDGRARQGQPATEEALAIVGEGVAILADHADGFCRVGIHLGKRDGPTQGPKHRLGHSQKGVGPRQDLTVARELRELRDETFRAGHVGDVAGAQHLAISNVAHPHVGHDLAAVGAHEAHAAGLGQRPARGPALLQELDALRLAGGHQLLQRSPDDRCRALAQERAAGEIAGLDRVPVEDEHRVRQTIPQLGIDHHPRSHSIPPGASAVSRNTCCGRLLHTALDRRGPHERIPRKRRQFRAGHRGRRR